MKKSKAKTCTDCIHEYACKCWTYGKVLADENATRCPAFETIKDSTAYFIGLLDGKNQKWINVKEKLPENDDDYLVFTSDRNGEEIATYYGDGEWLTHDFTNLTPLVTYWMPLPQPPKE